ncbi:hypothetical protein Hanom_Chr01g00029781 [Helianthus anomalus]
MISVLHGRLLRPLLGFISRKLPQVFCGKPSSVSGGGKGKPNGVKTKDNGNGNGGKTKDNENANGGAGGGNGGAKEQNSGE